MESIIGKTTDKILLAWIDADKNYREKRKKYDPIKDGDLELFLIQ